VIDENGEAVAAGEVGELVIKSKYVLLGYWENGQLSLPCLIRMIRIPASSRQATSLQSTHTV